MPENVRIEVETYEHAKRVVHLLMDKSYDFQYSNRGFIGSNYITLKTLYVPMLVEELAKAGLEDKCTIEVEMNGVFHIWNNQRLLDEVENEKKLSDLLNGVSIYKTTYVKRTKFFMNFASRVVVDENKQGHRVLTLGLDLSLRELADSVYAELGDDFSTNDFTKLTLYNHFYESSLERIKRDVRSSSIIIVDYEELLKNCDEEVFQEIWKELESNFHSRLIIHADERYWNITGEDRKLTVRFNEDSEKHIYKDVDIQLAKGGLEGKLK